MASSFLYPPNRNALSTNVIGNVMQRVKAPQAPRATAMSHDMHDEGLRRKKSYRLNPYSLSEIYVEVGQSSSVRTRAVLSAKTSNPKASSSANKTATDATARSTCSSGSSRKITTSDSALKKLRHRERCRENQRLYRQKQRDLKESLETQIQRLQSEIRELNARSNRFSPVPTTQSTIWVAAGRYFQHFQNFCAAPSACRAPARDFLQAAMARDVVDGELFGVEELLDNWTRFALCFDNIHLTLTGLSAADSDMMVAKTIASVTLSESSLRCVFPQLSKEGGSGSGRQARSRIAAQLLGQRVVMRGSVRFYWDSESRRLARMQSQSDMLTPLLRILGSLEDASRVFENALATPECRMAWTK
jgi:hypothetical protein